jgi:outer membrane protein insertion porin family
MMRWGVPLLLLALCWHVQPSAAQTPMVREVRVQHEGPGILDEASVLAFVSIQPGDPYNPNAINRDVRTLQQTERFSRVSATLDVQPDGRVDVIYVIESKPRIRSIFVDGAEYSSNRRVRDLLELNIGDRVDDHTLAVRAQKVYEHYRKRYFLEPKLTWTIEVDEAAGTADVRIRVKEGPRAGVWRITFDGNDNVSSRELRRAIRQRSWRPWTWLTKSNRYDPHQLDADRDALRRSYMDRGHLDVQVGEPIIEDGPGKHIRVRIPVQEGPVYRVGAVSLEGITLFPTDEVRPAIQLAPGDVASMRVIEQSRNNLRDFYGSRGYIRTVPRYRLEPDFEEAVVDLEFEVEEGELSYIRDIRIRGNTRTKDKVIRRELAIMPGEIFDEVRVRRSETRLRNMGYFTLVRSSASPTPEDDVYDLTFDVEEGKTGQLVAGVGFSSIDRVVGFAEIAQNNFDLFGWPYFTGGGQKVQLRTQIGSRRSDVDFTFVEPWFLDRQLAFDFNLFRREARYLSRDYDQRNIGGSVGLARPVGRYSRLRLSYGLEEIQIRNVDDDASDIIKAEEGRRTKSALTLTLTRDNFFVPTRGNRTILSAQVAGGLLQGDTDIYSLEARSSHFVPLWFGHVFSLRGAVEVVERYGDSDRVPIFDRLFLGGPRNVRGFRFRDVGPKDEFGEPIGGKSSAYASVEYTVPVVQNIRLATFYDVGMVWPDAYEFRSSDLNSAYGVGIRFDIPGFPLRFDYAWPLETDEFNDRKSGRFSFMIGHVF